MKAKPLTPADKDKNFMQALSSSEVEHHRTMAKLAKLKQKVRK